MINVGIFHNDGLLNRAAFQRHKEMLAEFMPEDQFVVDARHRTIKVNGTKYIYGTIAMQEDAYAYAGVEFQAIFCNTVCEEAAQYLMSRFRPR